MRYIGVGFRFPLTATVLLGLVTPGLSAQRSDCGPTKKPAELPAPRVLVDSSGALSELAASHMLRDSMRFTLIFPEGDSVAFVHPLDRTDSVAAAVLARSVWPEKPGELWAIQVRVVGGSAPALTLQRATYCPPAVPEGTPAPVIGIERIERVQRVDLPSPGIPPQPKPPRKLHAVYEIVVTETGDVRNLKMVSGSGVAEYDQKYGMYLGQLKFEPALVDGLPIEAVYRTDKKSPRL